MRAQIRLILADSEEADAYSAAAGADIARIPARTLADVRSSLDLAADLASAPPTSFVSGSLEHSLEVAAYLSRQRAIPVLLGEGVAEASDDARILAIHEIRWVTP